MFDRNIFAYEISSQSDNSFLVLRIFCKSVFFPNKIAPNSAMVYCNGSFSEGVYLSRTIKRNSWTLGLVVESWTYSFEPRSSDVNNASAGTPSRTAPNLANQEDLKIR
ncbi:hypothetical protein TNCV_1987041 [Trichonephila clavipes]|nr:hypothetical protein TNCV_1987041 [Trichonephila clavipes]